MNKDSFLYTVLYAFVTYLILSSIFKMLADFDIFWILFGIVVLAVVLFYIFGISYMVFESIKKKEYSLPIIFFLIFFVAYSCEKLIG